MQPRLSTHGNKMVFATQTASKVFDRCNCQVCRNLVHGGTPTVLLSSLTEIEIVRSFDQFLNRKGSITNVPSGSPQDSSQNKMIHLNS